MTKRLIICALVAIMPFAGVRVVCFNPDTAARQTAALRQQAADPQELCGKMCPRVHRTQAAPAQTRCGLVADSMCGFLLDAIVGLMPPLVPSSESPTVTPIDGIRRDFYVAPMLALLTPPPKA